MRPSGESLEKDLRRLINWYSQESGSDTPDFILADYLIGCLNLFNRTMVEREKWYGREVGNREAKAL